MAWIWQHDRTIVDYMIILNKCILTIDLLLQCFLVEPVVLALEIGEFHS